MKWSLIELHNITSPQGNKEVVYCTSFEQDASRRDLTINALSMTLAGEVFDYYDGVKDILSRKFYLDVFCELSDEILSISSNLRSKTRTS